MRHMLSSVFTAMALCTALPALSGTVSAQGQDLRLASLDQTELLDEPAWGDRMTVTRPFGNWTLRCELSVSQNRRLCSVEQTVEGADGALFWRLAQTQDARNVLIFSLPPAMKPAPGLTLKFGPVQTQIDDWTCSPKACLALTLLNRPLQGLLLDSEQVDLLYETQSGQPVRLSSPLRGLRMALSAAARDPFAKQPPVRKPIAVPVPKSRPDTMAAKEITRE